MADTVGICNSSNVMTTSCPPMLMNVHSQEAQLAGLDPQHVTELRPNLAGVSAKRAAAQMAAFTAALMIRCGQGGSWMRVPSNSLSTSARALADNNVPGLQTCASIMPRKRPWPGATGNNQRRRVGSRRVRCLAGACCSSPRPRRASPRTSSSVSAKPLPTASPPSPRRQSTLAFDDHHHHLRALLCRPQCLPYPKVCPSRRGWSRRGASRSSKACSR